MENAAKVHIQFRWSLEILNKMVASETERKIPKSYLRNKINSSGRLEIADNTGTSEMVLSHSWCKKLE